MYNWITLLWTWNTVSELYINKIYSLGKKIKHTKHRLHPTQRLAASTCEGDTGVVSDPSFLAGTKWRDSKRWERENGWGAALGGREDVQSGVWEAFCSWWTVQGCCLVSCGARGLELKRDNASRLSWSQISDSRVTTDAIIQGEQVGGPPQSCSSSQQILKALSVRLL